MQVRVVLDVASPGELLTRYFPNGKLGGLTIDGASPSALGQAVDLTVKVAAPPTVFTVKGQLGWVRHRGTRQKPACFGVDFTDDSSQGLIAFAQRELGPDSSRGHPRIPVSLAVKLIHGSTVRREVIVDLSLGGAFVRSSSPLPLDEKLELHLRPPGALLGMTLAARVAWVRPSSEAPGMGLEFLEDERKLHARLGKLIARLRRS